MMIIPLAKKTGRRQLPIITIVLILINCFVFIVCQRHDDTRRIEALQYYDSSGLGALEIKLYRQYLKDSGQPLPEDDTKFKRQSAKDQKHYYYLQIARNAAFQKKLAEEAIAFNSADDLQQWRSLRNEYEQLMEKVVTVQYGFRPAYPRPGTWLTAMFLHGGWGHLIGNMIFLWLIGALIEHGCRKPVFLVFYLLGGLIGTALFWLLNPHSTIPLIGASGAIAGIMGAFTVLYGMKKVRIFLNLGFYFNYLKFPALFILPFWMGNELFQLIFNAASPVAYAGHLGGLAGGAALAWGARKIPKCLDSDAFEPAEEDTVAPMVEQAMAHMAGLEFPKARELFMQVLAKQPDNTALWQHVYVIDRQQPGSPQHHQTTAKLLGLLCQQPQDYRKACLIFSEYMQTAKPPRLPAELYLRISHALMAVKRLAEAQQLLQALIKKAPQLTGLSTAWLKLAQTYIAGGETAKSDRCAEVLQKHFPETHEAKMAVQQLGR